MLVVLRIDAGMASGKTKSREEMRRLAMAFITASSISLCPAVANAGCTKAVDDESLYQCALSEFKKQDVRLNSAYRQLSKMLDKEGADRLKASQIAWIAFRDKNGEFYADFFRGGTAARLEGIGSERAMTEARANELFGEIQRRKSLGLN